MAREIIGNIAVDIDQRETGCVLFELGFFYLLALWTFAGKRGASGQGNRQYGRQDHGGF
jgi:hypothetical protein